MKIKLISLAIGSFCLLNAATPSYADDYYSSQTPGGYSSSQGAQYEVDAKAKHKKHDKFSISVNLPGMVNNFVGADDGFVVVKRGYNKHKKVYGWIELIAGDPIPFDAVTGGGEPGRALFVCRAPYNGGLHPGKVVDRRCNITWGGNEIPVSNYQVLVSPSRLHWAQASNGAVPPRAIAGGSENGRALYICQAQYNGGMHPGKLVDGNCNIGWGGKEIQVPYYNVLVK